MITPALPYTVTQQVSKNPEQVWILDLRRTDGDISVDYVKDEEGNALSYTAQRLDDKYLITLESQQCGSAKLDLT